MPLTRVCTLAGVAPASKYRGVRLHEHLGRCSYDSRSALRTVPGLGGPIAPPLMALFDAAKMSTSLLGLLQSIGIHITSPEGSWWLNRAGETRVACTVRLPGPLKSRLRAFTLVTGWLVPE